MNAEFVDLLNCVCAFVAILAIQIRILAAHKITMLYFCYKNAKVRPLKIKGKVNHIFLKTVCLKQ